jgi:SNARE associated Golgi protein
LRSDRAKDGYRWTERHVMARGSTIVIVGRFIPGGRTVTTFACGTVGYPYRRFLPADTVAAVAWACYTALLGFIGGNSFRDALWQPLPDRTGPRLPARGWRRGVATPLSGLVEEVREVVALRVKRVDLLGRANNIINRGSQSIVWWRNGPLNPVLHCATRSSALA